MHPKAIELVERFSAIKPDDDKISKIMKRRAGGPNYLIFFTARSGSSWLTELLTINGGLGRPEEWFNPALAPGSAAAFTTNRVPDYVNAAYRVTRDPETSVFGAEVTFFHLQVFNELINLFEFFPPKASKFFYLRRKDIVAQAISLYRMVVTGEGHSHQINGERRTAPYDADAIEHWLNHLLTQELGMVKLQTNYGITLSPLTYENMMGAKPEDVYKYFRRGVLGEAFLGSVKVPEKNQKLSSPETREWHARFTSDRAKFLAQVGEKRPPVFSAL